MRKLRFACCVVPALLIGTFGCHQTGRESAIATAPSKPGVSFDQTMVTVTSSRGRTDTATLLLRTTSARGDARIDVVKGSFPSMGPFSPGPHGVVIMHDGGSEMLFLNPDQKQYLSIKPIAMMEGMQKMLEGMGGSMSFDTAGSQFSLDSVGPGPSIEGHPTLTYRLRTAMKMTMTMMGQSHVVDNQSSQEIQAATDLGNFGDFASMNRFAELTQAMGFPKGFYENLAAKRRRIRGFPLRAVSHTTTSADRVTRTIDQTIETRNVKRLAVPDSLFVVPADYKPVTMPMMQGMPAH
ncbi:MAG: hypothetical protein ACXU9O_08770 [Gemmatimonadaceae bacterium]